MRRRWRFNCGATLLLACTAVPVMAKAPEQPKPQISPEADRILRDMGAYLKAAPQLSFHAEITHDDLLPTGQKLQIAATYQAAVRRPNRVFTEYVGDVDSRRLWYDGKTVTLYDPAPDVYATEPARRDIDATVEHLTKELGFTPPLSDLMTSDPAETLRKNVLFGFVVGSSEVDGASCHHLAFVERNIDWQVWVEDGARRLPRKLLITYKLLPGAPQFTAVLSDWDLATRPPDEVFEPQLPPSASRIEFLAAAKGRATKKSGEGTK
jgi:hypothetical protein